MIYQDVLDSIQLTAYAHDINRRARALGRTEQVTADTLRDRILESHGRCEWCGNTLVNKAFEIDHIYSLASGGNNVPNNLVVACVRCNRHKANIHPVRFALEHVARGGKRTELVNRLLNEYSAQPRIQLTLFDDELSANDEQSDEGRYRW
ncbi:MAG: HNH endonuclease [Chloroflexota bacterium]